jgi:hypothetical protein
VEGDFIGDVFSYFSTSEDERSPEVYRLWSAISMLAGSLERRVVVQTGRWTTFPNLYTLLVGSPGAGKNVIDSVERIMRGATLPGTDLGAFRIAPHSTTKASLVDAFAKAQKEHENGDGTFVRYHALMGFAEELGVLISKNDLEYLSFLNKIYNCVEVYEETRRGKDLEIEIEKPTFNFLGGVQPAILGSMFPEEHWTSGLARRMIMVFSDEDRIIDPFKEITKSRVTREDIEQRLGRLSQLHGTVTWSREAAEMFVDWHMGGQSPKPTHSKMQGYVRERSRNMSKLAGLSVISRTGRTSTPIASVDFERAREWMFSIERRIPEIFRAMTGRSDYAIIEELWLFVAREFVKSRGQGVEDGEIVKFVGERTTSDKVDRLIDLAKRMNKIRQKPLNPGLWEPTGKSDHKDE